ncbi:MAG TPA: hypothetical protein VGH09_04930, partial [Solirubrobacteraceae bacterium]
MSVSGQQEEGQQTAVDGTETTPNGVVEIDERRAKMERLRAEGVDPYPAVTLWGKRTRIAEILEAHDASE